MDLTLKDILSWILENTDNEDAMNKISMTAYPYSSKFKNRYGQNGGVDNLDIDVHT